MFTSLNFFHQIPFFCHWLSKCSVTKLWMHFFWFKVKGNLSSIQASRTKARSVESSGIKSTMARIHSQDVTLHNWIVRFNIWTVGLHSLNKSVQRGSMNLFYRWMDPWLQRFWEPVLYSRACFLPKGNSINGNKLNISSFLNQFNQHFDKAILCKKVFI